MIFQRIVYLAEPLVASLALVAIIAICGPASAWNSASNLSGYCETLVDELNKGVAPLSHRSIVCITYFEGVGDALLRQGGADPSNPCMAQHYLNLDDLRHPKIFLEYLKRNPTRGDDFASDVIRDSLKEICRQ
jgi:hypothetical protein